jgi:hypothetical protein
MDVPSGRVDQDALNAALMGGVSLGERGGEGHAGHVHGAGNSGGKVKKAKEKAAKKLAKKTAPEDVGVTVSGIDESGAMVTTKQSKKCDNDVKSIPSSGLSGLRYKEDWIGVPASDFQDDFVRWKMMELECVESCGGEWMGRED